MIQDHWQHYLTEVGTPDGGAEAPGAAPALANLIELAPVRFSGVDARKFLQGYLTCDTDDLEEGKLTPTALCNLKGRVVMNGWCAPWGEQAVLLILHSSLVETTKSFLAPYLRFSKTQFDDLRDECLVLGGWHLPADAAGLVLDEHRQLLVIGDLDDARTVWERFPSLSARAWLSTLTADGIPVVSAAVSGVFLPQMLNLEALGAVDFEKGCYLGQEVVARAQHRGQVKRRLSRLAWSGGPAPAPGSELTDDGGRAMGVVVQTVSDTPTSGQTLAVLQREAPESLRQRDVTLKKVS